MLAADRIQTLRRDGRGVSDDDDLVARGKSIIDSGRYAPQRGEYLGTIEYWGLPVYENSPPEWKDALRKEARDGPQ